MSTRPGSIFDAMAFTSLGPEEFDEPELPEPVLPELPEEPPLKGEFPNGLPSWSCRRCPNRCSSGWGAGTSCPTRMPRGWSHRCHPRRRDRCRHRRRAEGRRRHRSGYRCAACGCPSWHPSRRAARPEASARPATTTYRGPTGGPPGYPALAEWRGAAEGSHGVAAAERHPLRGGLRLLGCSRRCGRGRRRSGCRIGRWGRGGHRRQGDGLRRILGDGGVVSGGAIPTPPSDPQSRRSCPRSSDPPSEPAPCAG